MMITYDLKSYIPLFKKWKSHRTGQSAIIHYLHGIKNAGKISNTSKNKSAGSPVVE
ncbi:hypothetical protein [Metabacillus sediminilitoris]|uniref:hypothetical protein n=1 Tax=Metabacillus sediminilitoris TaxID=2567941 RepID=UPI001454D5F0|nr:hypothetical protein [Metabacillus sediminilitoris]